jgi:hypothetical protein
VCSGIWRNNGLERNGEGAFDEKTYRLFIWNLYASANDLPNPNQCSVVKPSGFLHPYQGVLDFQTRLPNALGGIS